MLYVFLAIFKKNIDNILSNGIIYVGELVK